MSSKCKSTKEIVSNITKDPRNVFRYSERVVQLTALDKNYEENELEQAEKISKQSENINSNTENAVCLWTIFNKNEECQIEQKSKAIYQETENKINPTLPSESKTPKPQNPK